MDTTNNTQSNNKNAVYKKLPFPLLVTQSHNAPIVQYESVQVPINSTTGQFNKIIRLGYGIFIDDM